MVINYEKLQDGDASVSVELKNNTLTVRNLEGNYDKDGNFIPGSIIIQRAMYFGEWDRFMRVLVGISV